MAQKRLLVDMDGTLARFHDEVDYLERMFEQGFFEELAPFENMVEGIRLFIKDHPDVEVYTCSAAVQSPFCQGEKDAWLDRYLPEISKENRIYTEVGKSKADYLPGGATKDDYLLDDYNRGLNKFLFDGGSAIKCHNNINQKGVGAHGGERGYMWEGPMVHAEDEPELIAAELAQLMGLEHSIDKAAQACNVHYAENENELPEDDRIRKTLTPTQFRGEWLYAAHDASTREPWKDYFENPFNALRHLRGDPAAFEYKLRTYDGEDLRVTGYQLQAICQNAYGNANFHRFMRADRAQLAEEVKYALEHREDAVVGFVCLVGRDGSEFELTPFYDHDSMARQIERCERNNENYRAEWFVEPPAPEREQSKGKACPLPFDSVLKDANRRANAGQTGGNPGKEPDFV